MGNYRNQEKFGAALNCFCDMAKQKDGGDYFKKFQITIAQSAGAQGCEIYKAARHSKGLQEDARMRIVKAINQHKHMNMTYYDFLDFGERLLSGDDPVTSYRELKEKYSREGIEEHLEFVTVKKAKTKLSAGGGQLVYEDGFSGLYHFRHDWLTLKCASGSAVLFDVNGDSMEPTIADGGVVLVDTTPVIDWADNRIYAIRMGDEVRIKRLCRSDTDGKIRIISDNDRINTKDGKPIWPDELRPAEEISIIGRVFWHAKEL